ncbi:MAG: class D sortase [Acidobacteria bacterium]|nr:class D sortase [Acidobacteriota bacterium]
MPPPRRGREFVSYVLILVGTVLCTFVVATYLWMYVQQRLLLDQWSKAKTSPDNSLTKLSIPKIHLEDVVLEGASVHSLLLGPAHLTGSALPGDPGNAVIAGHRDTFFRHVHSLKYGDDIFILRSGKRFHYVVRARRIVEPHDRSVLGSTPDPELTLITCYPTHAIGPAPERLIVVAKMAGAL